MSVPLERAFVPEDVVDAVLPRLDGAEERLVNAEADAIDPGAGLVALVHVLGEAGLLSLVVPEAWGGRFDDVRSTALCLAREHLGWISPLADLAFAMQGLGSYPISRFGTDETKEAWLPRVAAGDVVCAFAITEPEAGTDLGGLSTRATRDGDGYRLDGEKIFISNAGIADVYSVIGVVGEGEEATTVAFAVPADAPGLTTEPMHVLGGHPIGRVRLESVAVPASARLGEEGQGLKVALTTLGRFRTTVGAAAVGFAQRALDESVRHVKRREQFGAPLAELAAVQLRLADMACDVDASRLLVYKAASLADTIADRHAITRAGSMAKLVATESAQRVVDHAVQLHGGLGVVSSSTVARLYQEVRALRIYEGTTDVQKQLIAREVLRP